MSSSSSSSIDSTGGQQSPPLLKRDSSWPDPSMQEDGVTRFFVLLFPQDVESPPKLYTLEEADLDGGGDIQMSPLDVYFSEDGQKNLHLPHYPGYCCIDHTLFLAGGALNDFPFYSSHLLSYDLDASPPTGDSATWSICCEMQQERQRAVAVPYDGKLFLFGGISVFLRHSWGEIYDPVLGKFVASINSPRGLHLDFPTSYFLWKDGTEQHKKPLIVLHCRARGGCYRLFSYNVQLNHWELLDPNFPAAPPTYRHFRRNLFPLGSGYTLLIIDQAAVWSIYDLSSKGVMEEVQVQGLEEDRGVIHAFLQQWSDEGHWIFYIFMGFDRKELCYCDAPFAKVKLWKEGEKFVARLESKGVLKVGEYFELYMFSEQTTERTVKEAPFGGREDKKRMKLSL